MPPGPEIHWQVASATPAAGVGPASEAARPVPRHGRAAASVSRLVTGMVSSDSESATWNPSSDSGPGTATLRSQGGGAGGGTAPERLTRDGSKGVPLIGDPVCARARARARAWEFVGLFSSRVVLECERERERERERARAREI